MNLLTWFQTAMQSNPESYIQVLKKQRYSVWPEIWCQLIRGRWPKELGNQPPDLRSVDGYDRYNRQIMKKIESTVGMKACDRQWMKAYKGMTDQLFDDYWDDRKANEIIELLQKLIQSQPAEDNVGNTGKMLGQEPQKKRKQRSNNRHFILTMIASFCIGIVLMAFFKTFGLGALLFGLLLGLCGFLLAHCL